MTSAIPVQRSNQRSNSLVRALHRYRRGHGFDSRSGLNFFFFFFSGLMSQLLKLSIYCDDLHLLKMYFPQYKYMTFMYSYHND